MELQKQALDRQLIGLLKQGVCVAFSAGVDSTVLLHACCEAAKTAELPLEKIAAVTFATVLHPQADLMEAKKITAQLGIRHEVLKIDELSCPEVVQNGVDRCYHCKKKLFSKAIDFAKQNGYNAVIDGTNADDLKAYRPGIRAIRELGVISPLAEHGFTKAQVRQLAAQMGLSCATKPAMPCLATRLPYGTPLQTEVLGRIEQGEEILHRAGFAACRLRVHGDLVRIEIEPQDFAALLSRHEEISQAILELGFSFVTLDLQGLRSGCYDRVEKLI